VVALAAGAAWLRAAEARILFCSRAQTANATYELYTMNEDGTDLRRLTTNTVSEWAPAVSPDATRIAYVNPDLTRSNLYVMPLAGGAPVTLGTTNRAYCVQWLDTNTLYYLATTNTPGGTGTYEIWRIGASGTNGQRVYTSPLSSWFTGLDHFSVDRDHGRLYFVNFSNNFESLIRSGLATAQAPDRIIWTCSNYWDHYDPSVSPDGKLLAYTADIVGGDHRLYLSTTNGGCALELRTFCCGDPSWGPNGAWIVYTYTPNSTYGTAPYVGSICRINTNGLGSTNLTAALPVSNQCAHASVYVPFDDDGDGVADAWELTYFPSLTNVTTTSDADGDHFLDRDECAANTNPTNAQSYLGMQAPGLTADGRYVVRWQSVTSRTYTLQRTTNLTAESSYSNLVPAVAGQPDSTVRTDATATATTPHFYRVKLAP
jgi:hypothetical protein